MTPHVAVLATLALVGCGPATLSSDETTARAAFREAIQPLYRRGDPCGAVYLPDAIVARRSTLTNREAGLLARIRRSPLMAPEGLAADKAQAEFDAMVSASDCADPERTLSASDIAYYAKEVDRENHAVDRAERAVAAVEAKGHF